MLVLQRGELQGDVRRQAAAAVLPADTGDAPFCNSTPAIPDGSLHQFAVLLCVQVMRTKEEISAVMAEGFPKDDTDEQLDLLDQLADML